ncbi:MAG TPA: YigZ family protein [Sediminibacterium sp.]|nr:YigZ family protein [Sediminibacterium sp.]
MSDKDYFLTIGQTGFAEYKDRGSRFIASASPVKQTDDCKAFLQQLKQEHPKAVHHCFAYRLGQDGLVFRASDDGEPSGTAGKQILGQIDSKQLTDTMVVVVRYFGGTLLGVPGLIQAYKSATAMVLQLVPQVQKPVEACYRLSFDYSLMNEVMQLVKQTGCRVISQEMQLFSLVTIAIPKIRLEEVLFRLQDMHRVESNPCACS